MEGYKNNQIRQKKTSTHICQKKNIMNKLGSKRVMKTYT